MLVRVPDMQPFPAFPDIMEEVRSSWDRPALAPSVLKQASQLASLEGAEKPGLAGFPPIDSTIVALVKAPPVEGWPKDPPLRHTAPDLRSSRASPGPEPVKSYSGSETTVAVISEGPLRG
ncbi:UNVERIFIED_CONTAM: hypothetical protein FKN15_014281 [Acipenser sinensis]